MERVQLRVKLENLPARISDLPLDSRGYPVPWFVAWVDGVPEFRAMDPDKFILAIQRKLCWVCGTRLGANVCFVVGPMCGINRTSSEPASHLDCARWSARNCPFLSNPKMIRREDDIINNNYLRSQSAGIAIARNPGVTMLWITRQFEVFNDGKGKPLIMMGNPENVEWYCEGRKATREEVQTSIDTGIPNLEAIAKQEKGGLESLQKAIQRFQRWIPL